MFCDPPVDVLIKQFDIHGFHNATVGRSQITLDLMSISLHATAKFM